MGRRGCGCALGLRPGNRPSAGLQHSANGNQPASALQKRDHVNFLKQTNDGIVPPWQRADAPVAWGSGNGGLDQWRRRARQMRPSGSERQWVGLQNRHHQGPGRQAQTLVAHAAQLAVVIVAIDLLDRRIVQRKLDVGFRQVIRHDLMAVMRNRRFSVLSQAGSHRDSKVVRTAFRDGHPCARPQPQGHQAQQEAKE